MSEGIGAEELYSAIEESARLVDAPFSRDKVWPILSAYEGGFSANGGVIFSLQASERVAEMEYSIQVSPGIDDPYAHALASGILAETDHPAGTLLSEIVALAPTSEHYVDCGIVGGFKKIYANFPHDPQKVSKLADLPSMPRAVGENAEFFARYGLDDVALIGVDYKNKTMNLYFQAPAVTAGNLDPKTVLAMLRETGMSEPSEEMLAYAGKAYRIYTTLSWDAKEIHRISFAPQPRRSIDLAELPARLEPRIEQFMRATPHKYAGALINASAAKWSHEHEVLDLAAYYQVSAVHMKAIKAQEGPTS
ncbi:aromatic prenyltransferase [Streptomyces sp. NBC_00873]|uniref:aromatic prenyltransferase n=1 Tax=unclassified Streptomyces TaxID=2593676 RepID=UPI00386A93B0|nr:aromatic prenyltransferase [Streptomyces sp. NBC_00873]WTA47337.1 aromatic prenyltransferase [Streptomyces sp. NBC_00842]